MKYRIWHIPQVPMEPYYLDVPDIATGVLVLKGLALYDLFQFEKKVKPDFSNAQGLEFSVDGVEWEDLDLDDEFEYPEPTEPGWYWVSLSEDASMAPLYVGWYEPEDQERSLALVDAEGCLVARFDDVAEWGPVIPKFASQG